MTCKGICVKYKADKPKTKGRFESGQKRCQVCERFIQWEGNWCPCCGYRLRTRPRSAKYKAKLRDRVKAEGHKPKRFPRETVRTFAEMQKIVERIRKNELGNRAEERKFVSADKLMRNVELQSKIRKLLETMETKYSTDNLPDTYQEARGKLATREIVKVTEDGFDINSAKIEPGQKYLFFYDNSKYEIFKNKTNQLVMEEVG